LAKDVPYAASRETGHSHMRTPYEEVVPTSSARIAHRVGFVAVPLLGQWGTAGPSVKFVGGAKRRARADLASARPPVGLVWLEDAASQYRQARPPARTVLLSDALLTRY
jgi:hypothetical protein